MRTKFEGAASAQQTHGKDNVRRDQGAARAISSFIDPSLNWKDLKELTAAAKGMKVILKGVQTWEVGSASTSVHQRNIILIKAYRMRSWRLKRAATVWSSGRSTHSVAIALISRHSVITAEDSSYAWSTKASSRPC